jgi:hypothetical protein
MIKSFAFGLLLLLVSNQKSFACASCGSSGDDPLVLFPNEVYKLLIQTSKGMEYSNIDEKGTLRTSGGTETKLQTTASFGASLSRKAFFTITKSFIENRRGDRKKSGFGDWSFSGRYSLTMLSIDDDWSPQIQWLYGYKHSTSQSTKTSRDPYLLDVFGNGFSELKTGIDVWWGQWVVKPGLAFALVKPLSRSVAGTQYTPALVFRTTGSVSYLQPVNVKWVAGVTSEKKENVKVEGAGDLPRSTTHSFFLTAETMVTDSDTIRLTYAETGTIGKNINTFSSKNVSVSYMHSF